MKKSLIRSSSIQITVSWYLVYVQGVLGISHKTDVTDDTLGITLVSPFLSIILTLQDKHNIRTLTEIVLALAAIQSRRACPNVCYFTCF